MRTMAVFVIFSVVVACSMQVFAIDCSVVNLESIRNCNECIRCGGSWCNKGEENPCTSIVNDNWCLGDKTKEVLPSMPQSREDGEVMSPKFYAAMATVGRGPRLTFKYNAPALDEDALETLVSKVTVINTTQTKNYKIEELENTCEMGRCKTHLTISPERNFCNDNGGKHEFLYVKLRVENVTEEAVVKYHVPCACACSDQVERDSPICNGKGDFSCGVCNCHKGWSGKFCEKDVKCEKGRGDVPCNNPSKNDMTCSGNGECGECDKCICNQEGEGWQYFDQDDFCDDLGHKVTIECDQCLQDQSVVDGRCSDCSAIMVPCNETRLQEKDHLNRKVWVHFKEPNDDTMYAAMKDSAGQIYIMRTSSCKDNSAYIATNVNVTVPAVLGVLAVVGAVAAVAGYMMWKARAAPTPLSSQYQELDGPENSAGINPLYKSPTSSYNNPLWKGGAKV